MIDLQRSNMNFLLEIENITIPNQDIIEVNRQILEATNELENIFVESVIQNKSDKYRAEYQQLLTESSKYVKQYFSQVPTVTSFVSLIFLACAIIVYIYLNEI